MDKNLMCLDVNTLKTMFEREAEDLHASLLKGVSWDQLRNQRKVVTDLSIDLQAKRNGILPNESNPAEKYTRNDRNSQD